MNNEEYADHKFQFEHNRGYYSEDMVQRDGDVFEDSKELATGKRVVQYGALTKRMFVEKYAPVLHSIADPPRRTQLQPALRWKQFSTRVAISFPIQTIKPKVQLLLRAAPGEIPREVEVERRLRQYSKQSVAEMLKAAGVNGWNLVPPHVAHKLLAPHERIDRFSCSFSRFPLEWFDNFDFDCMRPSDWLDLGILRGERHPIPAEAFLPNHFELQPDWHSWMADDPLAESGQIGNAERQRRQNLFTWTKVSVQSYDPANQRWLVTNLETAKSYRIPRIFLMFLAEDPANFVRRIQHVLEARRNADRLLRLEMIVDSIILTGVPQPSAQQMKCIFGRTIWRPQDLRNPKIAAAMLRLESEVRLDYQRCMAGIELRVNLQRDAAEYRFLEMPVEEPPYVGRLFRMPADCRLESFGDAFDWLRINAVLCLPAVIHAMDNVMVECDLVGRKLFFTAAISKTASLVDFRNVQELMTTATLQYIKGYWVENLSGLMCMCLRSVGKGWFDIRTRDWGIYLCSKISRLMMLVKYHMQSALRRLVEGSIALWMQLLCKPCECLIEVADDYVWDAMDVINSPFRSGTMHVFYMVLVIDEDGPHYTSDPLDFEPTLLQLFDEPMLESHYVHLIDPMVLVNLMHADDLFLASVDLFEAVVVDARDLLQRSYHKARIPLLAYLQQYERHSEFYLMDKVQYLKEFKAADKSPQEYQDEISKHFRLKANLEATLPTSIQIGPFLINTETLKVFLVNKRHELATKLIDLLLEKLRLETQDIVNEYLEICRRLSEKPISIEVIFEVRDWMETLPDTITAFETQMRLKLFEYDILDYFWTPLPNEDFKVKWNALAGPQKCYQQMHKTREMFEEDTERFLKQQTADLVTYDEKVEALNMTVSTFSSQYDTNKTTEISIDIKKLWKQITETMEMGRVLNKRQNLFENPEIDLGPMIQLRDSFAPYKTLWVTGADFIKWEEAWIGNPLPNVVVENIRIAVADYLASIMECIEIFKELPKVQEVALYFETRIHAFEPVINVIDWIKNPAWIMFHWQELVKQTGLEIKFSTGMNFEYCMGKGIMQFYDEVREMSESATANREKLEWEMAEEERLKRVAEEEIIARKNRRRGRKLT